MGELSARGRCGASPPPLQLNLHNLSALFAPWFTANVYSGWSVYICVCTIFAMLKRKTQVDVRDLSTVYFWDFGPQMWSRIALVQRADNWWSLQKAFSGKRGWSFRIIILANAVRAQRSPLRGLSDHVELRTGLILFLRGLFSHTSSLGYYCLINYLHRNVPFK